MKLYFNNHVIPVTFVNKAHEDAYNKAVRELDGAEGPFTLVLLFILTAGAVTREHLWEILDPHFPHSNIMPKCLTAEWMTDEARFLVALACAACCEDFADKAANSTLLPAVVDSLAWAKVLHETFGYTEAEPEWP